MGSLRDELLKAIWHAFTALDHDHSGKVSKPQLRVLSYNLCTVLKVPHDPVALEEHFRDDDEGPVSNQGHALFKQVHFETENLTKNPLLITEEDAFKVWLIFNFLSEAKYPLLIVTEEMEYLLKKLTELWEEVGSKNNLNIIKSTLMTVKMAFLHGNLSSLLEMDSLAKAWIGRLCLWQLMKSLMNILDVLKQGYMMKKGHRRKNWTNNDENCRLESLPGKDGKKCLFLVKCFDKTFEIGASDNKKKQEWIQAIHSTIHLLKLGSPPPHKEARQRLKELRKKQLAEQEELEQQMKELQQAAAVGGLELQARFSTELEREKLIRQQMEEQVAQKSSELEQYLQRVQELEDMYLRPQEALEDERQARRDEETVRKLQARLLEEESSKKAELEKWHLEQQQAIQMTEAEKQELENHERALREAMEKLEQLELEQKQALEQYEEVKKKLEMATNKTKSWKDKVAHHEGLIRLIEPGSKNPHLITNWGPAAFTEAELEERRTGKRKRPRSDSACWLTSHQLCRYYMVGELYAKDKRNSFGSRAWWLTPVIRALWEAKAGGSPKSGVQDQLGQP
ncbi:Switch-associated protein 70, partial [Plecturocebus cupreus]